MNRIVDRTQAYALSQHASHELLITHPSLSDLLGQVRPTRLAVMALAFAINCGLWFAICKGLVILWSLTQ